MQYHSNKYPQIENIFIFSVMIDDAFNTNYVDLCGPEWVSTQTQTMGTVKVAYVEHKNIIHIQPRSKHFPG